MGTSQDVGGIINTPSTTRAEIRKTGRYVDSLSADVLAAASKGGPTPEQGRWFVDYNAWRKDFNVWAKENLNVPWSPGQVLATGTIGDQNDAWRKEAETKQAQFQAFGFTTTATSPGIAPGGPPALPTGPATFLGGLGSGGLLALAVLLYFGLVKGPRQ